ncbi:MAG: secretin N-terminal domain-containing protein [Planctomycetota bacterium]
MNILRAIWFCLVAGLILFPSVGYAQNQQKQDLEINLAENGDLDLRALVQFLANEAKLNIVGYSDQFPADNAKNKVIFFADLKVSKASIIDVVQAILRANGYALVKSDVQDLYQVVQLANVRPFAPLIDKDAKESAQNRSLYFTGVFPLKVVTPQVAIDYIKQTLLGSGSDSSALPIGTIPNSNAIVITDTRQRLVKINELIQRIDVEGKPIVRKFYKGKFRQASELSNQLTEILGFTGNDSGEAQTNSVTSGLTTLKINAIVRTNQVLLSGTKAQIDDALGILEQIDTEDDLLLKKYRFQNVSAKKIDELIRQYLGSFSEDNIEQLYKSNINEQANEIVVTTRQEIHRRIESLKTQLDKPDPQEAERSPIKFYTLKNVKAIDMLATLQAIEQRVVSTDTDRPANRLNGINSVNSFGIGGLGIQSQVGPGLAQSNPLFFGNEASANAQRGVPGQSAGEFGSSIVGDIASLASQVSQAPRLIPGEARLTVDENTNTLIVVADPPIQKLYERLIKKLDVRRPSVLIEVKVVTISGQDDFSLGIQISGGDRAGANRLFSFTNFGLSQIDPTNGAFISLPTVPGVGFNGVLVDPDVADVVIRALAQHQRARVVTSPQILVNDNAEGEVSSVAEIPFENNIIGNTASATGLGGFAEAGTTILVRPQISEDDYLNLEFDVLVNNFVGPNIGNTGLQQRNSDQVTSSVSIPDGHTVIVGGLTRKEVTSNLRGLPFIERIPILNRLTSDEARGIEDQRLFVFIRPVILRDDKFRDLRFLSASERKRACIPDDLPQSNPVLIR